MVMNISNIPFFQIFKEKSGQKEAGVWVYFVDFKLKENNDNYLKILATKEDISILKDGVKAGIARTWCKNCWCKIWNNQMGSRFFCCHNVSYGLYFKK